MVLDRVLLLAMPDELQTLAKKLTHGIIAALLPEEQVFTGRTLMRDFDNVMFTPADAGTPIPWRDGFFTLVYAPSFQEPTGEIIRVLAAGGIAVLAASCYEKG